jgi:Zn-dependent M28 family amino/carboxypeptidase
MFCPALRHVLLIFCGAARLFAQAPDAQIQKLLREVSADRMAATVNTLAGFGTRGDYSDPNQKTRGIGAARRWLFEQFHVASARLEVAYETARKDPAEVVSVVAVLPGVAEPQARILVTAHYDSINLKASGPKAAEAAAPGADDDASGTAVVLELARVMSQYRFRKSIVFIAFAGEELGLVGSTAYAARAKAGGQKIEAVFNNDIVGANVIGLTVNDLDGSIDDSDATAGDTGNRLRVYSPDKPDSPHRRLARLVQETTARYVPEITIEMMSGVDRFGRLGDHIPFQNNGFPAIRFTSASEHTVTQHTANDLPSGLSPPFNAQVARVNAAAIATLAGPSNQR